MGVKISKLDPLSLLDDTLIVLVGNPTTNKIFRVTIGDLKAFLNKTSQIVENISYYNYYYAGDGIGIEHLISNAYFATKEELLASAIVLSIDTGFSTVEAALSSAFVGEDVPSAQSFSFKLPSGVNRNSYDWVIKKGTFLNGIFSSPGSNDINNWNVNTRGGICYIENHLISVGDAFLISLGEAVANRGSIFITNTLGFPAQLLIKDIHFHSILYEASFGGLSFFIEPLNIIPSYDGYIVELNFHYNGVYSITEDGVDTTSSWTLNPITPLANLTKNFTSGADLPNIVINTAETP